MLATKTIFRALSPPRGDGGLRVKARRSNKQKINRTSQRPANGRETTLEP